MTRLQRIVRRAGRLILFAGFFALSGMGSVAACDPDLGTADLDFILTDMHGDGRDVVKDEYGPLVGFPTTFVIDRDGRICHKHAGFAPKSQFAAEISALL